MSTITPKDGQTQTINFTPFQIGDVVINAMGLVGTITKVRYLGDATKVYVKYANNTEAAVSVLQLRKV